MKRLLIILGMGAALFSPAAYAQHIDSDELIEGAKLCTAHLPRYEREYGIPTHLLSAIATTETGRYHEGLKIRVPWPWTINAEGKGYIFDSKAQAIAAVRRLKAHGVQSIDVGCMQVNIYHHPDAFASLDQAFEPQTNIAYAASFLRGLYDESGSWKKAAADYHSKTPQLGRKYVSEVYTSWYQIIDKLRAARLAVPEISVEAMNELKAPVRKALAKSHDLANKAATKLAAYHPHMNSVSVSKQAKTDNGVILVKPDITLADNTPPAPVAPAGVPANAIAQYTPQITVSPAKQVPLTLEDSAPSAGGSASAASPNAGVVRAGDPGLVETSAVATRKTGPNFIFND